MLCSKCGMSASAEARYCAACGADMRPLPLCPPAKTTEPALGRPSEIPVVRPRFRKVRKVLKFVFLSYAVMFVVSIVITQCGDGKRVADQFNQEMLNLSVTSIDRTKENVRMEEVCLFPEKYVGRSLVFGGCTVGCEIYRSGEQFSLDVTSRGGLSGRVEIPQGMAKKMAPYAQHNHKWEQCAIQCRFEKDHFVVMGIDLYGDNCQVVERFRAQ